MHLLNVCGCREYLENMVLNQILPLSYIEAKYRGVVNVTTQCLWLQEILGECGFKLEFSTIIYHDNQSTIALSSTEAEYRGVVNATTHCLWLEGILGECGFKLEFSTTIYCDNQITIRICNDPV